MRHTTTRRGSPAALLALFGVVTLGGPVARPLAAQAATAPAPPRAEEDASTPRSLTPDAYDRWRTIESVRLSPDGEWVTFAYGHRVEDDTLIVRGLADGATHELPRATDPVFSDDSRWLAYRIVPPKPPTRGSAGEDASTPEEIGLLDLDTGHTVTWTRARAFAFANGSSHLAVHKRPAEDAGHEGRDLVVRDLGRGVDMLLGNVESFAFNERGDLLAYAVDAVGREGNGLYALDLETGVLRTLDQAPARYAGLAWNRAGTAVAALRGLRADTLEERTNALVAVRGLDGPEPRVLRFEASGLDGLPAGHVLSERGDIRWRDDGSMVFVGLKPQRRALEDDTDHPRPDVDVFHWADDRIQSVQRTRGEADRNVTFLSAVDLERGRLVPLADSAMRRIFLSRDGRRAVGRDDAGYLSDWKEDRADYHRIDLATGERTRFLEGQGRVQGLSPDGRHFAFWRDAHVWVHELETGATRNLTASAPVSFVDAEFDHPGTPPPYGLAGWTADGRGMVLEHRYDLWLQPLDGSPATNLTGGVGAREEIRFRVERIDPEAEAIDLGEPLILSAYGEWTKKSGWYELDGGRLTELVFEDRGYDDLVKATDADRYLFRRSTFAEFPDLWTTDGSFREPERLTDANPQQAEYAWGHRILFEYENPDGVRLQGTLAIPDSYEEGERLPMIVLFYEKKSQDMHDYYTPRFESDDYPPGNPGPVAELAAYVSNGYLVMQPDVHFNTGTTHTDMLDCVTAATRKVIEMGYADPERIGLGGGSFSGGGAAFIATRTDLFAAIVSRAAPINLAGEFNILFSGSGENNHQYDIYGQGRYGTNPFDDFELYREQSPITHVESMDTPFLYLHGVQDGSVEYLQGMEFYNALRFLGKPIIFLSYPDEGHNLHRYESQRDFVTRLWQFWDHHLKGAPAPRWMTHGVRFLDRHH